MQVWALYQNAKSWYCRPSQAVGITGVYRAFCFDEAVTAWGNYITNELEQIEGKTSEEVTKKRKSRLLKLLGAPDAQRFRKVSR